MWNDYRFSFGGCLYTQFLQCHLCFVPYALVNLDILIGSQVNHDVVVSEENMTVHGSYSLQILLKLGTSLFIQANNYTF